ncbi:hypothetical protein ANAPH1_00727 [Anaplasma phagocytophilum]|nr:hypothetical protein ANAPH1_00727 [Anaplasma phagocytophilum]
MHLYVNFCMHIYPKIHFMISARACAETHSRRLNSGDKYICLLCNHTTNRCGNDCTFNDMKVREVSSVITR